MSERQLFPWQEQALTYCKGQRHRALFMEMRLGKTLVVIREIKQRPQMTTTTDLILVVAPSSALGSWEDELINEGEAYSVLSGTRKKRLDTLANFGLGMRHWFLLNKEGFLSIGDRLCYVPWNDVILDESTFIKNPKAKVTKYFTHGFRFVNHRWILTGTPDPEGSLDIFCQLKFVFGGMCGHNNFYTFREKNYQPAMNGYHWDALPSTDKLVREEVRKKCFICKRSDVLTEIKGVSETRYLDFPVDLRALYMKTESEFSLLGRETIWATVRWHWLRRICNGFVNGKLVWNGKINELLELLQGELKRQSVVVWFSYNLELNECYRQLQANGIMVGKMTGDDNVSIREQTKKNFQEGLIEVLLCQIKVADMGMNLSKADVAIYFSEPVSALSRRQSADRIYSVNKKYPLLYLYLVVRNTVEHDIRINMATKMLLMNYRLKEAIKCRQST